MSAYQTTLLVLHVLGAIVGIGPTYAFAILGPMAEKAGASAPVLLEAMLKIEKVLVTPVAMVTQPVTGVLLIFKTGRDDNFFKHEWLVIAIVLYLAIMVLSYGKATPSTKRMLAMMRDGTAGSPAFMKEVSLQQKIGPLLGLLGVIIAVLMVWKPFDSV